MKVVLLDYRVHIISEERLNVVKLIYFSRMTKLENVLLVENEPDVAAYGSFHKLCTH